MAAKQLRTFEYQGTAYRVTEGWLRAFVAALEELGYSSVVATVDLPNRRRINDLSLEELLALRNSRSDRIEYLSVGASRYGTDNSLFITLSLHLTRYELRIYGAEREAVFADSKLRGLFEDLALPYGWLASSKTWVRLLTANFVLNLMNTGVFVWAWWAVQRQIISLSLASLVMTIAAVLCGVSLLVSFLPFVAQRLFPSAEILIGEGIARSEKLAEVRGQVFWVVVVGLTVVILGSILTKVLGLT